MVKKETIQLMRTNYVPKHSQDYANSQYVSYVGVRRKGAEFIGNKRTNSLTRTCTQTLNFIH